MVTRGLFSWRGLLLVFFLAGEVLNLLDSVGEFGFVQKHDGDVVADGELQATLLANEIVTFLTQRGFSERTPHDFN